MITDHELVMFCHFWQVPLLGLPGGSAPVAPVVGLFFRVFGGCLGTNNIGYTWGLHDTAY